MHDPTKLNDYCQQSACNVKLPADFSMCCKVDPNKCKDKTQAHCVSGANWYLDPAKVDNAATSEGMCCTEKAKCSNAVAAGGHTCNAAEFHVNVADYATKRCATSKCEATECCMKDTAKCGGATVTCPATHYKDTAKNTNAVGADKGVTACCTAKAMCDSSACNPGFTLRSDDCKKMCATKTCSKVTDNAACCTPIVHQCHAKPDVACGAGKYQDTAKGTNMKYANDYQAKCCTAQDKCGKTAATLCSASNYMKANTKAADMLCTTKACGKPDYAKCCEMDTSKCGGITVDCGAGMYQDPSKASTPTDDAGKKNNCCTAQATCAAFQKAHEVKTSGAQMPQVGLILSIALGVALLK